MAVTHITIGNTTEGNKVLSFVSTSRSLLNQLREVWGIAQTLVDVPANPTDYTQFEAALNLTAGQGAVVYGFLKTFSQTYDVAGLTVILDRLG